MGNQYIIKPSSGAYIVKGPKDANIIAAIKSLPVSQRRWNPDDFVWLVAPEAINRIADAIERAGYTRPTIPPLDKQVGPTTKTFTVEYIGAVKDTRKTALGSIRGYWSIEFSEQSLKDWFDSKTTQTGKLMSGQTYYQVLCVFETASPVEIKSAYKRLAAQWHPDRCHEPDAADRFMAINDAYKILSDQITRKRYDAGLYFEREAQRADKAKNGDASFLPRRGNRQDKFDGFKPPLRCGVLTVEGVQTLNRFVVSKILQWDDITDGAGRVMVASWNKNLGPVDYETGKPTGGVEIKWY